MPDIHFNCSRCVQKLVIDAAGIGLTVPCPTCGTPLVVPQKDAPPPVAPEKPKPPVVPETKIPPPVVPELPKPPVIFAKEIPPPKIQPPAAPEKLKPNLPVQDNSRPKSAAFTVQGLAAIVRIGAKNMDWEIEEDAAEMIARSSDGTSADVLNRLRRTLDYARSGTLAPVITLDIAAKALKIFFPEDQGRPPKTGKI